MYNTTSVKIAAQTFLLLLFSYANAFNEQIFVLKFTMVCTVVYLHIINNFGLAATDVFRRKLCNQVFLT